MTVAVCFSGFCRGTRGSRTRFRGGGTAGGDPTETIIAIVIGSVTFVAIVVVFIVFCCCCPRRSCTKTKDDANDIVPNTTSTGSATQPDTELRYYPPPYTRTDNTVTFNDGNDIGSLPNGSTSYKPIHSIQKGHESLSSKQRVNFVHMILPLT